MTQARARGKVRPENNPIPPVLGTKGYIRIVERGCGGYQDSYTGEYDCTHPYGWACDDCPVCMESNRDKQAEWVVSVLKLQGPPREFKHPGEFWMYPTVATELYWSMSDDEIKTAVERYGVGRSSVSNLNLGDLLKKEGW